MGAQQSEYEPSGSARRAGTDGLLKPLDLERYTYKQRIEKLANNLKNNANVFRAEGNRFRWLYFLSVLFPSVAFSGSICVIAAWGEFSHKGTVMMILAILNAFLAMLAAFWDWQGASAKHNFSSRAFEHLLTRAKQMKIECEQRPEKVSESDLDMLNQLYAEMGQLYEKAPNLPQWTLNSLQRRIEIEKEKKLRQVDDEERREGGIGRTRAMSNLHAARMISTSLRFHSKGSEGRDMIQKAQQQQYQPSVTISRDSPDPPQPPSASQDMNPIAQLQEATSIIDETPRAEEEGESAPLQDNAEGPVSSAHTSCSAFLCSSS